MKTRAKVGIVQTAVPFTREDGEKNILRLIQQAKEQNVDILGLPEDCICGLIDIVKNYNALEFLSQVAKEKNICLFGSNALQENDQKFYGTGFFFDYNGKLLSKVHKIMLTPPELKIGFTPGNNLEVFNTEFGKMAILVCKDGFSRYTPIWVYELKKRNVDWLLMPSMSLRVDDNSVSYWTYSLWLLGRNFDMHIIAPGTIGKNYTPYPSFGNSLIVDRDNGFLKKGSEDKEELLIVDLPVRSIKEIESSYRSKWQPIDLPEIKIVEQL